MPLTKTLLPALSVLALAGFVGCGSNADQSAVVAKVSGVGSITKSDVDHWTRVEFILSHEYVPTKPVPQGVVPDPPSYTHCISYLRRSAQGPAAQSPSALKAKCKQTEDALRANTLKKLIAWDWTIGRAHSLGLQASDAEVHRQFANVFKTHILYGYNLSQYLKFSEQTMADLLFRSRVQLFENEMANKAKEALAALPKGLTEAQKQAAYVNLARKTLATKRWVAKTSCRTGYVVSACRQYRGPEPPPGSEA